MGGAPRTRLNTEGEVGKKKKKSTLVRTRRQKGVHHELETPRKLDDF